MSIETRYEVALEMTQSYRKATKKEKGRILRRFCELTGYNPKYAVVILKKAFVEPEKLRNRTSGEANKQKRKRRYGELERAALAELWKLSGYLCGKLLVAFISENLEQLRGQGSLRMSDETALKLMEISPATTDRLLKREKVSLRRRRDSSTKPGLLRNLVRLALDYERPPEPGHLQVDLVIHCVGNPCGHYVCTVSATDIFTGWSVAWACLGKLQQAVFEALEKVFSSFPFPIKSFQTDNGSEFLNAHLVRWSSETGIDYIKSQPYKKEENAYVVESPAEKPSNDHRYTSSRLDFQEERNGHLVRKFVGYLRLDTHGEAEALNEAYESLILLHNLFIPRRICLRKERKGSRVRRVYDKPRTPLRRVLPFLDKEKARELVNLKDSLSLEELFDTGERITRGFPSGRARKSKETLSYAG